MLPANKLSNLRRRVNRARRFPDNTCSASRHVHLVADQLLCGGMIDPREAEYVATALLSVLESLWKARTRLARLQGKA